MEKIVKSVPKKSPKPPCWKKVKSKTHIIPVAGNTWVSGGQARVTRSGLKNWSKRNEKINTYFKTSEQV